MNRYYVPWLRYHDRPNEKVIIGAELGIWTWCCVASVEQHVEPAGTNRHIV